MTLMMIYPTENAFPFNVSIERRAVFPILSVLLVYQNSRREVRAVFQIDFQRFLNDPPAEGSVLLFHQYQNIEIGFLRSLSASPGAKKV